MDLKKFRFKPGVEVTNRNFKKSNGNVKFVVSQLDAGTILSYTGNFNYER